MLKISSNWRFKTMLRVLVVLVALVMAGCQSTGLNVPDAEPVVVPVILETKKEISPPPPEAPLAVVVSANVPAYLDVKNALTERLATPFRIFNLDESTNDEILAEMRLKNVDSIVAIGGQALSLVSGYSEKTKIIYSQIFNPVQKPYRGVAAIPPMEPQLKYWQSLNLNLQHIGVVSSAEFRPIVNELIAAGKTLGIQIVQREVASDKAALHEFRRLIPVVEGFIILPDASILSPGVLRRMVQHANANSVELLSYNLPIFNLGAYMHVTSAYDDIAERIVELLNDKNLGSQNLKIVRIRVRGAERYVDIHG